MTGKWCRGALAAVCGLLLGAVNAAEVLHLEFADGPGPGRAGHGLALAAGESVVVPVAAAVGPAAGSLECWVRAYTWDAAATGAVELLTLALGNGRGLRLVKPADRAVLRLSRDGEIVAEAPVYEWYGRGWARGKQANHGWRLLTVTWSGDDCRLYYDGVPVPAAAGADPAAYPATRELRLGGAANPVAIGLDEVRLHDVALPAAAMADRFLALYYNQYDFRQPRVTATFLASPPRIDGTLAPGEWAAAAAITGFTTLGKWTVEVDVQVQCAYDAENLYLAFRVPYDHELAGEPNAPRDQHPWSRDNIETYLDPSQGLEPAYYQLTGNCFGASRDNRGLDAAWDANWQWRTSVASGVWTAEARIPFRDLERAFPEDGHVWGANFTGARPWCHWSRATPFHSRQQFGHLVFDRRLPVVRIDTADTATRGAVTVAWSARNPTAAPLPVAASLVLVPPGAIVGAATEAVPAVDLAPGETRQFTTRLATGDLPRADVAFAVTSGAHLVSYQHWAYDETARPGAVPKPVTETTAPAPPPAEPEKRWPAEVLGQEVLRREKWEGNTLGISDDTMPPWPPIETAADRFRVWGRELVYGDGLLPRQITSQGTDLLAGPVRLVAGQGRELVAGTRVDLVEHCTGKVAFTTTGKLAGLSVTCRQTLEFDGMLRVDLTVQPDTDAVTVDELALEVPLRPEVAGYYHVIGDANQPPATDVGEVPAAGFTRGFVPQVWLGSTEVGLAWFAEEFRDWQFGARDNWIQVVPGARQTLLRVRFVSAPGRIAAEKTFTFGLQATPMRPRPAGWRKWHFSNTDSGADGAIAWKWFWGPTSYCFSHDLDYVRKWAAEQTAAGRPVVPISSLYYYAAYYLHMENRGWGAHPKDGMITPEYKLWGKEWDLSPYTVPFGVATEDYRKRYALTHGCIASSYQDYYVYMVNRMIEEAGITGLYLDQPLKACGNAAHGCGYVDSHGVWQPRYLVFADREAMKRLRRLYQDKFGKTMIMFHMSNQVLVPVVSLGDIFYDGETYNSGPLKVYDHYSAVIPLPRYRIQHSLRAFGPVPMLMSEFMHRGDRLDSTREFMGYNLLHDCLDTHWMAVRDEAETIGATWRAFAGRDGTEFSPYWAANPLATASPDTVKVSCWRHGNEVLLVAVNTDPDHMATARVTVAAGAPTAATDAFSGAALPVAGAVLELPVRNLDFRLVKLQVRAP